MKSANENIPYKIFLSEDEMPTQYYNVRADMEKKPAPLLNPGTLKPITAEELEPIFCKELVKQELDTTHRHIDIPEEIREFYKMYRPSPLVRAYCLEEKLQTPAKIYYKFEGNNTSGSHKLNSAIAQAYYAKQQGLKGVTTETGAGQWGTALSMACAYFGLDCKVFMLYYKGRIDFQVKFHGYRIELGDIEQNLLGLDGVKAAAVIPDRDGDRIKNLAAFITDENAEGTFEDRQKIRNELRRRLPKYMVPKKIIFVDNMPMTPNGKTDRRKLEASL